MLKRSVLLLIGLGIFAAAAIAQTRPTLDQMQAGFAALESKAPRDFPTVFVVASASQQPGGTLGSGSCSMYIETLGKGYSVGATDGFSRCEVFAPGTLMYGRVHQELLGLVVDLIDADAAQDRKPKGRRYIVSSSQLLDPNTQ